MPHSLTEIMLLGVVALRANTKLHYDGANMRVTNHAGANEFLSRTYRQGIRCSRAFLEPFSGGESRHPPSRVARPNRERCSKSGSRRLPF